MRTIRVPWCRYICRGLAGAVAFVWLLGGLIAQEKEKADKGATLAAETAQKFLKAAKNKDLDTLLKISEVPWFDDGEIIKDRDQLKKLLKSAWVDFADEPCFYSKIIRIISFGQIRERLKGQKGKLADEILGKDDWVVLLGRNGEVEGALCIRGREGKGKVVGAFE